MIIPFVFNYEESDETLILQWIFDEYLEFCRKNQMPIIAHEIYFEKYKDVDLTWLDAYKITAEDTQSCVKHCKTKLEKLIDRSIKENAYYEKIVDNIILKIQKNTKQKIEALLVWVWSPSLAKVAQKHNIKIILSELSSIRQIRFTPYNVDLCYFQCADKYDVSYCQQQYDTFMKETTNRPVHFFSRKQLLAFVLKTEKLDILKKMDMPIEYELGISPGLKQDEFFTSFSKETVETSVLKATQLFGKESILIRFHPDFQYKDIYTDFPIDDSSTIVDWILKCKRVLTSVSNLSFDAMLLGRTCYILTEHMPFSFMATTTFDNVEEHLAPISYINFMMFCYFVPREKILDMDYIRWRLSEPSLIEIYQYHKELLLKQNKVKETDSLAEILKKVHHQTDEEILCLTSYNAVHEYRENQKQIEALKEKEMKLSCKYLRTKEELETSKRIIQDIQNSKSWKITEPLRKISLFLRKHKSK